MARGKDGSLLTKEQLIKLNRQRFDEGVSSGNLYNTGPITAEGGTEFGTDRWASYFEDNPEEAPNNWIVGETTSETYLDESTQEFVVDKDETKIYDDKGELIFQASDGADNANKRGLTGDRDADGSLRASTDNYMRPIDVTVKDGETTDIKTGKDQVKVSEVMKGVESRSTPEGLKDIADRAKDRERRMGDINTTDITSEVEREIAQEEAGAEIEQEDSMENWMDNFESMSDEQFETIKFEDLAQYGANAEDAYTEVKLAKDKSDNEFTDAQMDAAETDREAMEMGSEFDAEIAQDQADEDQITDADAERMMMEATADADKLDADYEVSTFPMMNMSDKDKGMFQFQKTDTIANEKEQASIDTIMGNTDMNPEQARQLMTKLKGICG